MITFGYKSKLSSILRSLAAVGLGLVMIFGGDSDSNGAVLVVKILAAFLFASGLVSLVYGILRKDKENGILQLMAVNAVVDILIGLVLFLNPGWVAQFIVKLIGIGLIIMGIVQMVALIGTMSLLGAGFPSLLFSIIVIGGGAMLIFSPFGERVMGIIAGFALVVYGLSDAWSYWRVIKAQKEQQIRFEKAQKEAEEAEANKLKIEGLADAKEAEFSKVEE